MYVNGQKLRIVAKGLEFDDFTDSSCNKSLMLQNDLDGHPMIGTF